jgi:DNA replication ATP-dependent helicase Dna2
MTDSQARLLSELRQFVEDERDAGGARLMAIWERPLEDKLREGWSQRFLRAERGPDSDTLLVYPDDGESRFREGDLLQLHAGRPSPDGPGRHLAFEAETDTAWLLRGRAAAAVRQAWPGLPLYADVDAIDLSASYEETLAEIARSEIGRELVLPLLAGELEPEFHPPQAQAGRQAAAARGFNRRQVEAVGLALGAIHLACIQGPPGTGKSAVLALAARLMVERGDRVLVTSHTHMAINNALNRIAREGVAVAKIGLASQCKGLDDEVPRFERIADWDDRPARAGHVVGATPFATCSPRLQGCEFDTVLFDEASQVTVPLALMAMRKARRFVFVGDQRQLPPVVLSRSVLDAQTLSAFAALTSRDAFHTVMLEETYRMNRWLAEWPSRTHYGGALRAAGPNRERRLALGPVPDELAAVFAEAHDGVFIAARDPAARTRSTRDAELVARLCAAAVAAGLAPDEIGVVTPYRAQGRAIRGQLARALGPRSRAIVADTVERMQGQERELVILSLVSADLAFLGAVAEFFFQPQRLNVAVTRARTRLIVIGPPAPPAHGVANPRVRRWIEQYADLLAGLHRVELA